MKIYTHILAFVFIIAILIIPAYVANAGLVPPCGPDPLTGKCIWGFTEFMKLIDNVIKFIILNLALPIAAIMFAYAGFLLVTAPGEEAKTKAKSIFTNVVIGLVLAVGAWLIVKTLLSIAGYKDIDLFFKE
jgi:amino acid transporter